MKMFIVVLLALPSLSWAWGKRGHQIVGESAALVVASETNANFMHSRSYDFGYYANVPDFIWKRPATYKIEKNEHFMDLEIFERAFASAKLDIDPLALSRKEFEEKFPDVKPEAGRAFWRVRELVQQIEGYSAQLRGLKPDAPVTERHAVQEKWLVAAGVLAHYIGDLAQPLHVSENYDGQLSGQKGIHSYFEDDLVEQLYPELAVTTLRLAKDRWPEFKKQNANLSVLQLLKRLTKNSMQDLNPLLALDKKTKREVNKKTAAKFQRIIEQRLVDATLTLAEIYRRNLGWKFDGNRFYFFAGEPVYIHPGGL